MPRRIRGNSALSMHAHSSNPQKQHKYFVENRALAAVTYYYVIGCVTSIFCICICICISAPRRLRSTGRGNTFARSILPRATIPTFRCKNRALAEIISSSIGDLYFPFHWTRHYCCELNPFPHNQYCSGTARSQRYHILFHLCLLGCAHGPLNEALLPRAHETPTHQASGGGSEDTFAAG
jgi:hypothetical protein